MKPYLKNSTSGKIEKAVIRNLGYNDMDELMHLQEKIIASLTDPSLFFEKDRTVFENALACGDEIIGIFSPHQLCGCCLISMPKEGEDSLASDAGLPVEESINCALIDSVMVAPEYHHNGIARELISRAIHRAVEGFGAKYILTAVSPKDTAGVLSLLSINGMRIKSLRQKQGCRLRYILCYAQQDRSIFTAYERFPMQDVYSISKHLADGYEGIATFSKEKELFIWLAK